MDDFLTRLADRQLQPGHGVRPVRPSRFEPLGAAESWGEDAVNLPATPRPGVNPRPSPGPLPAPARADEHPTGRPVELAPNLPAPLPARMPPRVDGESPSTGIVRTPNDTPPAGLGAYPRDTPGDVRTAAPAPLGTAKAVSTAPLAFGPRPLLPHTEDVVTAPTPASHPAEESRGPALVRHGWRPEPVRMPDPLTLREPVATAPPAAAAEPEVTVTIGRLEIRPPAAPAPASAPARPRPEPRLSLADYLADRDQGRR